MAAQCPARPLHEELEPSATPGWRAISGGCEGVYVRGAASAQVTELGPDGGRFRVVRVSGAGAKVLQAAVDAFLAEGFGPIELVRSVNDPDTTLLIQTLEVAEWPMSNDNARATADATDGVLEVAGVWRRD